MNLLLYVFTIDFTCGVLMLHGSFFGSSWCLEVAVIEFDHFKLQQSHQSTRYICNSATPLTVICILQV